MFRRKPLWLAVVAALAVSMPAAAHAEEEAAEQTAPVKKKAQKPRAKPKTATPAIPDKPVPYTSLTPSPVIPSPLTPSPLPHAQPVMPGPPTQAMTPDTMPQPVETSKPIPPPSGVAIAPQTGVTAPPPPSPQAIPPVAPTVGARAQITLKCETQVTQGKRVISTGAFYIDLFPSEVFPDQTADFKFLFAEPAHRSLIRSSVCLDTLCPAQVTESAYYLVNRVTKTGAALRITLDRSRGAFHAEEIDDGLFGVFGGTRNGDHLGESGYCTPQTRPARLF